MTKHAIMQAKLFFKPTFYVTGVVACCVLAAGCNTIRVVTPKQAFFSRNPAARAHYVEFNETSVETIQDCSYQAYLGKKILLASVKQNLPGANTDAYCSAVQKRLADDYEGKVEYLKEMQRDLDPDRDSLFYYSYRDRDGREQGWAIVRDGQIRKKFPLATTFHEKKPAVP